MKQLPDEVRRAVLGIVHVLGYPLEEVVRAADRARARYGSAPLSPELWYGAIKEVLISGDDGSSQPPHQPSAPS